MSNNDNDDMKTAYIHLSKDEIQTYFDLFKNDNNEISLNDLTNIWALRHNSVVSDALFGKQDKLCYNKVRDKSIINRVDFNILDVADGKIDGYIQKSTLNEFDIDSDEVIDRNEYVAGMHTQIAHLLEDGETANNNTEQHGLQDASPDVPNMDV